MPWAPAFAGVTSLNEGLTHARSTQRVSHRRSDLERRRAARDDDPRRSGRRRDQGRGSRRRRRDTLRRQPAGRVYSVVSEQQPQQALDRPRSEDHGRSRGVVAARRRRRCVRTEFPSRRRRPARGRRRAGSRCRAAHRLCLDQRLRREGALCRKAGLRPGHPGLFGAGDGAGGLRRGAAAIAAHDPAGQIDRDHRFAGDHRRAARARAHRRRSACPSVDAGSRARFSVGLGHGRSDLRRRRAGAAGACEHIGPDLRDGGRVHDRSSLDRPAMGRLGARRRPAGLARRRAIQDAGIAPEEHRRAAGADPGGIDGPPGSRMARAPDRSRHPLRPGADPQSGRPASAGGGARPCRRDRPSSGRAAAPDPRGGALLADPAGHPPRRAGARRAHAGSPGRTRLFGRRNRAARVRGTAGDRLLLLADAERVEGRDHARGVRSRLPRDPGQYRPRRPVQAGIPGDQPQQPDAGDRRLRR